MSTALSRIWCADACGPLANVARPALVGVLGVALAACVGPLAEELETHYADVAAARRAGAFSRGWLPEIVPDEAVDIWEMHNLDTNNTWACFSTPEGPERTRALLKEMGARRVTGPVSAGPGGFFDRREWWPAAMTETSVETYEVKESSGFTLVVGVVPDGSRVCFFRT